VAVTTRGMLTPPPPSTVLAADVGGIRLLPDGADSYRRHPSRSPGGLRRGHRGITQDRDCGFLPWIFMASPLQNSRMTSRFEAVKEEG
jgi:hypothetical protein